MTLSLLDLYNSTASQEWAMYDSDAISQDEMEKSLIIAINKALTEILYSYPFKFRERTHILLTIPKIYKYELPKGIILKDSSGTYRVRINTNNLNYVDHIVKNDNFQSGLQRTPEYFSIEGEK